MLKGINWVAVIVASVLVFLLGYVWYVMLFQAPWDAALVGATLKPALSETTAMAVGFVNIVIISAGLAWVIDRLGATSVLGAVIVAFAVWFFFDFTTMLVDYLYVGLSRDLVAINMGYQLASYLLTGAVLGLMKSRPSALAAAT